MSGSVKCTTTTALARSLRIAHSMGQVSDGKEAWEVPAIYTLREWIRKAWTDSWPTGQLLHPAQELALYMSVIDESDLAGEVLSKTVLGRQARQAGAMALAYELDLNAVAADSPDQEAFGKWHGRVLAKCASEGWLTNPMLESVVSAGIRDGSIQVPESMELYGVVNDLTPAERRVLEAAQEHGCRIEQVDLPAVRRDKVEFFSYSSADSQYRDVAVQIRDLLLPFDGDTEQPPSILVLTDNFEAQRPAIDAAFEPILAPWLGMPDQEYRPVPWRYGLGKPVTEYPLVALAMDLLKLEPVTDSYAPIGKILLSNIVWSGEEQVQAAALDLELRNRGGNLYALSDVAGLAAELKLEAIAERFGRLSDVVSTAGESMLMSEWASNLEARLESLGWPGEVDESSTDYQTLIHWQESVAVFNSLDSQLTQVDRERAWHWMREILATRRFSARTLHLQPIEILTYEQAAGLTADYVFVLNMHERALPRPVERNPLIQRALQWQAGVPLSSPQDALLRGRQTAAQVLSMGADVRVCCAKTDERGVAISASTLIREAAAATGTTVPEPRPASLVELMIDRPLEAVVSDDAIPPVSADEIGTLRGVSSIFADFVEAPFAAFAKARLGLREFPEAEGLTHRVQGNLVHDALMHFWRQTKSSDALHALGAEGQAERVRQCVLTAAREHIPEGRFGKVFSEVERSRVEAIVGQWLDHERRRVEPFKVIRTECRATAEIGGLKASLRLDRVDKVETQWGARYLVIDYKTGSKVETRGWDAEKLSEPQLPMYASSAALDELGIERVDGICFAHVKDGQPAFVAATNWREYLIKEDAGRPVEDWAAQLAQWRRALEDVAKAFLEGEGQCPQAFKKSRSFNRFVLGLTRNDELVGAEK